MHRRVGEKVVGQPSLCLFVALCLFACVFGFLDVAMALLDCCHGQIHKQTKQQNKRYKQTNTQTNKQTVIIGNADIRY
jgi:hypothetical protein